MLTLRQTPFGSYAAYDLHDPRTGALARVVPAYGATLVALRLPAPGAGAAQDVLVGPPPSAWPNDPKFRSSLLLPFVNRIRDGRYTANGQPYQLPLNEPARAVALHGFVFHQPFSVVAQAATAEYAYLTLAYDAPGTVPGYPFPFRVEITYTLAANGLAIKWRAQNTGSTALPLGVGWHPYFQLGGLIDELVITAPVHGAVATDPDRLLPTGGLEAAPDFKGGFMLGPHFIDQTFTLEAPLAGGIIETTLYRPATGQRLTLWQDAGPDQFTFLHLYTDPSRTMLALEPVSSAPDAFNTGQGLLRLEPGGVFEARCGVRIGGEVVR